jgi:putative chitinase
MATWPARFPTEAFADTFARQPIKIANYVYAMRLGNGPPECNDGWNFRGGGIIQITGRTNYKAAARALDLPLDLQPAKIEQPLIAARVAGWFWRSHGLNELADTGDFERITETINGPAKLGLAERIAFWEKAKTVLGGA